MSARAASGITGARKHNRFPLLAPAGNDCQALLCAHIGRAHPKCVWFAELWAFVHTKEGHLHAGDPAEWGDTYAWAAAMDVFSPAQRSEIMRRVRSKDTKPEIIVRRLVSFMGFRYRLHSKVLSSHPDLVFNRLRKVIFVHGCFWHGHSCRAAQLPASNQAYWKVKRARNTARDRRVQRELNRHGWKCLVVWECQANMNRARKRIRAFLAGDNG
ncbi:MAG: very short patch repair endonuclease [Terriglobia bacterium]